MKNIWLFYPAVLQTLSSSYFHMKTKVFPIKMSNVPDAAALCVCVGMFVWCFLHVCLSCCCRLLCTHVVGHLKRRNTLGVPGPCCHGDSRNIIMLMSFWDAAGCYRGAPLEQEEVLCSGLGSESSRLQLLPRFRAEPTQNPKVYAEEPAPYQLFSSFICF